MLRKELVRAQQLMDEITLQKDAEVKQHLEQLREMSTDREKYIIKSLLLKRNSF